MVACLQVALLFDPLALYPSCLRTQTLLLVKFHFSFKLDYCEYCNIIAMHWCPKQQNYILSWTFFVAIVVAADCKLSVLHLAGEEWELWHKTCNSCYYLKIASFPMISGFINNHSSFPCCLTLLCTVYTLEVMLFHQTASPNIPHSCLSGKQRPHVETSRRGCGWRPACL